MTDNVVGFPGKGSNDDNDNPVSKLVNEINQSGQGPMLKEDDIITCSQCGGIMLAQAFMLGRVSALQTQNGQPGIAQIPGPFICLGCGNTIEDELKSPDPTKGSSGLLRGV